MTEAPEQENAQLPAIWQPSPFEGTDLLPVAQATNDLEVVGDDDIDDGDTILPVLQMLQGTAVNDVPGAQAGMFYNTVTKELFEGPIRVLIISHSKGNSYFVNKNDPSQNGNEDCFARDGVEGTVYGLCSECPKNEWDRSTKPHKKPICNKQHKIIVMTPSGPAMIRFQSSSYNALKGLFTAKKIQRKNFFDHPAHIHAIGPIEGTKEGGRKFTYYKMEVKWDTREQVPLATRKMALETYNGLKELHAAGKLRGGEEIGDEPETSTRPAPKPAEDYGDVPF